MNIKIKKDQYQYIFDLYDGGLSQSEIAKKFNVSNSCIERIFKKEKKDSRKFNLFKDESFFEKIDTEEKAYFLGLIYADGWVRDDYVGISLQESDSQILDEFAKCIKYSGSIKEIKKKKENHSIRKRIEIYSTKIVKDMNSLGVVKNKSLILKFPTEEQVPKEQMGNFLRGVFDGDGSISIKKTKDTKSGFGGVVASITSSKYFCNDLEKFLKQELNISCCNKCDGRSEAHDLKISGRQGLVFLDFIYKNSSSNLRLSRKFDKFKNSLLIYNTTNLSHTHGSKIPVEIIKEICNKNYI